MGFQGAERRGRYSDDAPGDIAGEGIPVGLVVKRIEELIETGASRWWGGGGFWPAQPLDHYQHFWLGEDAFAFQQFHQGCGQAISPRNLVATCTSSCGVSMCT